MTTTHPAFAWSLPGGEEPHSISVARSPKINPATNDFMPGQLAQISFLGPGVSTWTPKTPLPAGTYYWHVASRSESEGRTFSRVSTFAIRPLISKLSIEAKTAGRLFLVTTRWTANERKVDFVARLFQGSKRLGERKLATENFLIDSPKQDLSTWIVPASVKKGARLRLVVSLRSESGAKASKSVALRAP